MLRIMLASCALIVACAPSPRKTVMPRPIPASTAAARPLTDSPAEALGRRIFSTAFVRIGPDGHLTVQVRHGTAVLVLRDVVMGPKQYCGVEVNRDGERVKYCGGYADVTAARPGGEWIDISPN